MSIEELLAILSAIQKKEDANRKFMAALQGIDLDEKTSGNDITDVKGLIAQQEGFGIGLGLGHIVEE